MKFIYICHKLFGDGSVPPQENFQRIDDIARLIALREPDAVILSPVHAFKFLPWDDERCDELGRRMCLGLLSKATEMRVFSDYSTSRGCMMEIEEARRLGIPVLYGYDEGELSAVPSC